jgi:PIN domain nuclease of toxin-antitoxin system
VKSETKPQTKSQPEAASGILLDTHIWIWLFEGSPELSNATVQLLDEAAQQGQLFIPAICVWEVSTLVAKKRLSLSIPLHNWIPEALSKPGVELLALSPEISMESTILPGIFHADPADRIIVATARIKKLALITRDQNIHKYAKQGHLKVIKG